MLKSLENKSTPRDEPKKYTKALSDSGSSVTFRVEPFWRNYPNLWFQKIEAQLSTCNVDIDTRKYNFLISFLDQETALEVKDIIVKPPHFNKYTHLKEQLIKRVTEKNEKEARERMLLEPMGNRTPSEFYFHLKKLASCSVRDDFVIDTWLECLPYKMQSVLKCVTDFDDETLTTLADSVHEVFFIPTELPANTTDTHQLMEKLIKEVEDLNRKVQTFRPKPSPCRARSHSKDKLCTPSKSPKRATLKVTPCKYHTKA